MTNDKKAREYKAISSIKYDVVKGGHSKWEIMPDKDPQVDGLHLIEYSAYESLQKRVEELETERAAIVKAHDKNITVLKSFQDIFKKIEPEMAALKDERDDYRKVLTNVDTELRHFPDRSGGYYGCTCKDDIEDIIELGPNFNSEGSLKEVLSKHKEEE